MSTDTNPLTPEEIKAQKDKIGNQHYWDWFDAWWDQDFSWDGLSKRKIDGWDDGRTLQDYWRGEEGNLIEFAGKMWTRFHLPPHDREGKEKSGKYGLYEKTWQEPEWLDWRNAILRKLDTATEYMRGWGFDTRAQLTGICFPYWPDNYHFPEEDVTKEQIDNRTLHIRADWALFGSYTNFSFAVFGDDACFSHTFFSKYANFRNVIFKDYVDFSYAIFLTRAHFTSVIFGNNCNFKHVVFDGNTLFDYATFGPFAHFDHAKFYGTCIFGMKVEQGETPEAYDLSFKSTKFYGDVHFTNRVFQPKTDFTKAEFHKLADFHGCKFHQDTSFADTQFYTPPSAPNWLYRFMRWAKGNPVNVMQYADQAENAQRAFRTLRHHMELNRATTEAYRFGRLELISKEKRVSPFSWPWPIKELRHVDVPLWERFASRIYGGLADYGQSALLPLGLLFLHGALRAMLIF